MESMFEADARAEMLSRIRSLDGEQKPEWGKMDAAQMMAHCQLPLRIAMGEVKSKRSLIGRLLGGWAKRKYIDRGDPFSKGGPTDPRFIVRDSRNFENERTTLIDLVEKFGSAGADGVTKDDHPFFGVMTPTQWDKLMWKHLDHHMRQFGK